eukprot:scaffold406995_cov38-Prasinocladus_malaysianus.AAC.1
MPAKKQTLLCGVQKSVKRYISTLVRSNQICKTGMLAFRGIDAMTCCNSIHKACRAIVTTSVHENRPP